jgi:hypothetical protein
VAQRAVEFSTPELHHLDVGSVDRLLKALKVVEAARVDRE